MEPFLVVLPHRPEQKGCGLQHGGEEFVIALKGVTIWTLGDKEYTLHPGDSLYFDSSIPHWGRSNSQGESEVLDISMLPAE